MYSDIVGILEFSKVDVVNSGISVTKIISSLGYKSKLQADMIKLQAEMVTKIWLIRIYRLVYSFF